MRPKSNENHAITTLRHRILFIVMIFATIIIVGLILIINYWIFLSNKQVARSYLRSIATSEMAADEALEIQNSPYQNSQAVTVMLDASGNMTSVLNRNGSGISEDRILDLLSGIRNNNKLFGSYHGIYYYLYNGDRILLLDNSVGYSYTRKTITISTVAGVVTWFVILILVRYSIKYLTLPITKTMEQQQQFITDAEHELKTPVAVISANVNVLQNEIGDNRWLTYIANETHRMDILVKSLMELVHSERMPEMETFEEFDLSSELYGVILPMESLAFEHHMLMDFDIDSDIRFWGNRQQLTQLATILVSNAITYGEKNGTIRIGLHAQPLRRTVTLSVYNTGQGIAPEELDKIFHRFYRSDLARKRSDNHYGLGLSIASAIVNQHQGHIDVKSDYGKWVEFQIVLPCRRKH